MYGSDKLTGNKSLLKSPEVETPKCTAQCNVYLHCQQGQWPETKRKLNVA